MVIAIAIGYERGQFSRYEVVRHKRGQFSRYEVVLNEVVLFFEECSLTTEGGPKYKKKSAF